jgi:nitrite reductase/ring-hydroxylating ferredoxin subunit
MAWQVGAKADQVKEGEVLGVTIGRQDVALYRIGGTVYATSNVCSHEFALLSDGTIDGDCIECPLHQAKFHIPSGAVRAAPADAPIATYPVKLDGDRILVDLPGA